MKSPLANDPDNLLEISFHADPAYRQQAVSAVAAALEIISRPHPNNPRAEAKRSARVAHLKSAWPVGFEMVELAVSEYLTRAASPHGLLATSKISDEAEKLVGEIGDLQRSISRMATVLDRAEKVGNGTEIHGSLSMANGYAADALSAMMICLEFIKSADNLMPAQKRGSGGALARMRLTPEVALYNKLAEMWRASGLEVGKTHYLDVFLERALMLACSKEFFRDRWFEKISGKATSKKNSPEK